MRGITPEFQTAACGRKRTFNDQAIDIGSCTLRRDRIPAFADFNDGLQAYRAKDYETAAKHWTPLAEDGDARAQTNLGLLYARGLGVEKNGETSLTWFRKAAEQGYATAEFNLATLFSKGISVEKNQSVAAGWFLKAAEHGHVGAQFEIARRYTEGNGIQFDQIQAYVWLTRAEKVARGKLLDQVTGYKIRLTDAMSEDELAQAEALIAKSG